MLPLKGLHRKVFTQQDWWFSTTLWKVSSPSFPQPLYSSPSPRSCALGTLQITQGCIAAVSSGEGSFTILSPLWGNVGWQAQLGWSFASRHNWTPWGGNCLSQRIVSMSNNPSLLEFFTSGHQNSDWPSKLRFHASPADTTLTEPFFSALDMLLYL